jgi:hypothetical protein
MKFHQLPLQARFRYQGKVYRKVSPLQAHCEADATQRLVPRSAVVAPLDAAGNAPASPPMLIEEAAARLALENMLSGALAAARGTFDAASAAQFTRFEAALGRIHADAVARISGQSRKAGHDTPQE